MAVCVIENPFHHPSNQRRADVARDYDPTMPPQDILDRYGAVLLDPRHAEVLAGHSPVRNTAYVAPVLLVPSDRPPSAMELISTAALDIGLETVVDEWSREVRHRGCDVLRFTPGDGPVSPPDAWRVLQRARALAGRHGESDVLRGVGLEHLLFASPGVIGSPYHQASRRRRGSRRESASFRAASGGGGERAHTDADGMSPPSELDATTRLPEATELGRGLERMRSSPSNDHVEGSAAFATDQDEGFQPSQGVVDDDLPSGDYVRQGDRQPVAWIGPMPVRGMPEVRRPVVAILDNGCGSHPWLDGVVRKDMSIDGIPIGFAAPESDPEVWFDLVGPLDGSADALAGHGTFMAGLVHLACPDADIVAARIVETDGVVLESVLVNALTQIAELVRRFVDGEEGGQPVDVLVLSMGYYHEQPFDEWHEPILARALDMLGELGVIVVAAAGNDATSRPMYPAAFAPSSDGKTGRRASTDLVPVVSVGASNPDGGTAALFSNSAAWVRAWEPGASLVSTMPVTFHGGIQPAARTRDPSRRLRESIDPDDYSPGFAVWSGTSFAAPVLGGKLAADLLRGSGDPGLSLDEPGRSASVMRAWRALQRVTAISP